MVEEEESIAETVCLKLSVIDFIPSLIIPFVLSKVTFNAGLTGESTFLMLANTLVLFRALTRLSLLSQALAIVFDFVIVKAFYP